jgi:hypothetical protein
MQSWAVDRYYCDCQAGAEVSCVAGNTAANDNNTNNTSAATPRRSIDGANGANSQIQNTSAGDRFLFCKGGAWAANSGFDWGNATSTSTANNPVVLDSYTPAWGGSSKPYMAFASGGGPLVVGAQSYSPISGITIRNLSLKGTGVPAGTMIHGRVGIWVGSYVSDVVIDNMTIVGFDRGVTVSTLGTDNTAESPYRVTIKKSTIKDGLYSAIFANMKGAANFILIENNVLDNNGSCAVGTPGMNCKGAGGAGEAFNHHSVYIAGGEQVTLRSNVITRSVNNSAANPGACAGPPITGHGVGVNWVWENNLIYEALATGSCYALGYGATYSDVPNEGVKNFVVRNNVVAGAAGNYAYVFSGTPGILLENNVAVINRGMTDAFAIVGANKSAGQELVMSAATLRNNSVYYAAGTSGSAISFGDNGYTDNVVGSGHTVTNNLTYIAVGSIANCFKTNSTLSSQYIIWNYNLCFNAGSGTSGGVNTPFASSQSNGLTVDPLLVAVPSSANGWSMAVQQGSPAKNSGINAYCSARDKLFLKRDSLCDRGAFEYGASSTTLPPASATGLR